MSLCNGRMYIGWVSIIEALNGLIDLHGDVRGSNWKWIVFKWDGLAFDTHVYGYNSPFLVAIFSFNK